MKNSMKLALESIAGILLLLLQPWGYQRIRETYVARQFTSVSLTAYVLITIFLALILSYVLSQHIRSVTGKKKYGILGVTLLILVVLMVTAYDLYWNNPVYWAFWFIPISMLCRDV